MRFIALGLLALLLAAPANGATITSTSSGAWDNAALWDSGTVPTTGDYAVIAAGHDVTASGTVTADSMRVIGTFTTAGDVQMVMDYVRVFDAGTLTISDTDSLIHDSSASVLHTTPPLENNSRQIFMQVTDGGTINIYGHLAAEAAVASAYNPYVILAVGKGATANIQGVQLSGDSVTGLGHSAAPKQRITVGNAPADATHLRVNSGRHAGSMYEIAERVSATEVLLTEGKKGTFLDIHAAGADSGLFLAPSEPLEHYLGSMAVWGDDGDWTNGQLQIVNLFDAGIATGMSTWYDTAPTSAMVVADSVYVSEALHPGSNITWFRAATISGNVDPPELWTAGGSGEPTPGEGGVVIIDGDLDVDWAHIRNMGNTGLQGFMTSSRGTIDVDYTWFDDFANGYMFTVYQGDTDAGKSHTFTGLYASDNWLLWDDGSDGHFFQVYDQDDEDTFVIEDSGSRRLTDDFSYNRASLQFTAQRCWTTEALGNVAFHDSGFSANGGPSSTFLYNNWAIGTGDNPVQLNGTDGGSAVRSMYMEGNYFSRPQVKWNRYDAGDGLSGDALSAVTDTGLDAIRVIEQTAFTSLRDTLQWYPGGGFDFSTFGLTGAADTVYVKQGVFRDGGFLPGDKAVNPSSTSMGAGVGNWGTGASNHVVVESCSFIDNGIRGDLNNGSFTFSAYGVSQRGGAGAQMSVRGCLFQRNKATAITARKNFVYNYSAYPMYISDCTFLDDKTAESAVATGLAGDVALWRNQFVGFDRFTLNLLGTGEDVVKFNTFHVRSSGKRAIEGVANATIIGNVFLQRSGTNAMFRFNATADTAGCVIDWNIYRINSANPSTIVGAGAPWLHSYDQNGSVVVSGGSGIDDEVRAVVWRELLARPIAHNDTTSVAIDFITDTAVTNGGETTDEDGTALDAGAMPRLVDR